MQSLRSANRRPTHPGELLREEIFPALGLTQEALAERLGVSRLTVSELLHAKRSLSPEMAVRLARLLGTSPESWLVMQVAVDVWDAQQQPAVNAVKPLKKPVSEAV
jgi:addiction module HigA family antidote